MPHTSSHESVNRASTATAGDAGAAGKEPRKTDEAEWSRRERGPGGTRSGTAGTSGGTGGCMPPRYTRCLSLVVRVQCSQRTASSIPCVHPTSPHIHPYRHSYIHTYHGTMNASACQGQSRMHGYAGQPLMKFHWINSGCPCAKNSASPRLPFPGDISHAASRSYSRSLVCLILGC